MVLKWVDLDFGWIWILDGSGFWRDLVFGWIWILDGSGVDGSGFWMDLDWMSLGHDQGRSRSDREVKSTKSDREAIASTKRQSYSARKGGGCK